MMIYTDIGRRYLISNQFVILLLPFIMFISLNIFLVFGIIKMVRNEVSSMAMSVRNNAKDFGFILGFIEDYVPENHLVRKLEEAIDWCFIYPLVKPLYSLEGRPSIDPVILFKMIFINYTFGINSMRKTCEEIKVNLAYRWFLGISLDEEVPNYSTWSQNYIRRYGDSTHQKACANKRKSEKKEAEITRKKYEEDLLREINEDRKSHNKKCIDHLGTEEYDFDEVTGEQIIVSKKKQIKASLTDPDAGNFHKGDHEECFAYSHQSFCDPNGFIIAYETVAGNIHDSASFYDAYEKLNRKYEVNNVCLDAGYKTPAIAREVSLNDQKLFLPYNRPKGMKKDTFSKKEFVYDPDHDVYICPNDQLLKYSTTDSKGYRIYKSDRKICKDCPLLKQCTSSKNHQKSISVHIWQKYLDECEERRHSDEWKQTIERDFGDCKENHCLRFTRLRGLKKNSHQAAIIFSSHNLKKIALWRVQNRCLYDLIDKTGKTKEEILSLSC